MQNIYVLSRFGACSATRISTNHPNWPEHVCLQSAIDTSSYHAEHKYLISMQVYTIEPRLSDLSKDNKKPLPKRGLRIEVRKTGKISSNIPGRVIKVLLYVYAVYIAWRLCATPSTAEYISRLALPPDIYLYTATVYGSPYATRVR